MLKTESLFDIDAVVGFLASEPVYDSLSVFAFTLVRLECIKMYATYPNNTMNRERPQRQARWTESTK